MIVIGAGVIGVCSAWYLREAGFEVTVVERRAAPAQESSFGNAGVIAPGYVTPWAAPGMPGKVLRNLFASTSPVLFRPSADPAMWRWIARWLGECTLERYRVNKLRMQRLAFYSRECLHTLRNQLEIDYEQSQGYLQLFRTERDRSLAEPALALLREHKVPHRMVDAAGCRGIEPGLTTDTPLAGGLTCPRTNPAIARCSCAGCACWRKLPACASSWTATPVRCGRCRAASSRWTCTSSAARATRETLTADRVLVSAGVASAALLRVRLACTSRSTRSKATPATVQVSDELQAPLAALMDESYKVAITRMGNRDADCRHGRTPARASSTCAPRPSTRLAQGGARLVSRRRPL
ncbi:FAD-dependent oxidoreductase [Cupriavidus basilensis]